MKKLIRKMFLTATVAMMSIAFYSCKEKNKDAVETNMDNIETTEPVETIPADSTTMAADTVPATAPAP